MNKDKIKEFIQKLPKVELHLHLDGALRPGTILEAARKVGHKLPADNEEELKKYVCVSPDCNSLAEFLKCFEVFYPVLMDPEVMSRVAYEVCEDCHKQNIKYCEIRFAPILQAKGKYSMEEILNGVLDGLKRAHYEFGIINPLILCCMRSEDPQTSIETVELAHKYRDSYRSRAIVGIDLAGDEEHFPASPHKEAFELARKYGFSITVHAGEAGPPENIKEAIEELGASRIGHGIQIVKDKNLYKFVKEKQIPFEVCITSNVHTAVVKDYASHPFPQMYKDGLNVTINTDDPGISNITLSDEYFLLYERYGFSVDDIIKIIFNGIESSFTTEERKEKLKEDFLKEIKILRERYGV